jgi:hypothetical protein
MLMLLMLLLLQRLPCQAISVPLSAASAAGRLLLRVHQAAAQHPLQQ